MVSRTGGGEAGRCRFAGWCPAGPSCGSGAAGPFIVASTAICKKEMWLFSDAKLAAMKDLPAA